MVVEGKLAVCVCVWLPLQMDAEQIEVGGHFVSLSPKFYLVLMEGPGLIFMFHPHKFPLFNTQISHFTVAYSVTRPMNGSEFYIVIPLELIKSNRDGIRKAREALLISKGKTLEPHGINRRDET